MIYGSREDYDFAEMVVRIVNIGSNNRLQSEHFKVMEGVSVQNSV